MKLEREYTLEEVAALLESPFKGDPSIKVTGINEIHVVEDGDIAFVDHPKYYDKTLASAASVVLINKEVDCPEGKGLIIHPEPFDAFNSLTDQLSSSEHATAHIAESALIHAGAHIAEDVSIGEECIIHAGVVLYPGCKLGNRVIVHANTVIGSDAFYYKKREGSFDKLYSVGEVIIEDDVEIGACCTIDRGATGTTSIGEGTKIDNHVHIGHDTTIGKLCLLAAHVGLAGCVRVEDEVTIWGQVGIASDVTIGKGATLLAQSGVGKSLDGGKTYFGSPAAEARQRMRELATLQRISKEK